MTFVVGDTTGVTVREIGSGEDCLNFASASFFWSRGTGTVMEELGEPFLRPYMSSDGLPSLAGSPGVGVFVGLRSALWV